MSRKYLIFISALQTVSDPGEACILPLHYLDSYTFPFFCPLYSFWNNFSSSLKLKLEERVC
jgi:hypothetical protein